MSRQGVRSCPPATDSAWICAISRAPVPEANGARAIRAPSAADPGLAAAIRKLRGAGEVVVVRLPVTREAVLPVCDRELAKSSGKWW